MYIGYNVQKINEVMTDISEAFSSFQTKVDGHFEVLQSNLRSEWVGPDEQDFEEELIKRLNNLLEDARNLTVNSIDNVYNLGCAWADFQDKNTIDGKSTGVGRTLKAGLDKSSVAKVEKIVFSELTFDSTQNLGLSDSGSQSSMASALSAFVTDVKSVANSLFSAIEVNSAFFGSGQQSTVKKYIESVGTSIGVIESSIKDFNEAMATLTGTSYGTADEDVGTQIDTVIGEMESGLDNYGESRWS